MTMTTCSSRREKHTRFSLISVALSLLTLFVATLVATTTVSAQSDPSGRALFNERCARCHGETGAGDGEMAVDLPSPPAVFNAALLESAVPADLFNTVTNGRIPEGMPPFGPASTNTISEDNRWRLVTYLYQFISSADQIAQGQTLVTSQQLTSTLPFLTDYAYLQQSSNIAIAERIIAESVEPVTQEEAEAIVAYVRDSVGLVATAALLEDFIVQGTVTNMTNGDLVGNVPAVLRGFTPEFELGIVLTETVNADGSYSFDVGAVPAGWVFMTTVAYQDLSYSSDFDRSSAETPVIDLNVGVFEQTTSADGIQVEQLHMVLEINNDLLQVAEIYSFSNLSSQVFVGEAGDPALGTVRVDIPESATNLDFQRGFGSLDSLTPALDLIPQGSGFLDVQPLRPGQGTLNLLVQYALPYEDNMTLSHALPYATNAPTIVLRDVGITLGDAWQSSGVQTQQGEDFILFEGESYSAGSNLELEFSGEARARNSVRPAENSSVTLAIGGIVLLAVLGGSALAVRAWQTTEPGRFDTISRQDLLLAISELDEAYQAGEIDENGYQQERLELIEQLRDMWE